MFCASLFPTQKNLISIDLDRCRFTVLFAIPTAVALSQCTRVRGCVWPKSSSVFRKIFSILAIVEEGVEFGFSRGCQNKT